MKPFPYWLANPGNAVMRPHVEGEQKTDNRHIDTTVEREVGREV